MRASMKGIRRALGSAVEQKTPFSSEDLRAAFGSMGDALRDDRDRALLAVRVRRGVPPFRVGGIGGSRLGGGA